MTYSEFLDAVMEFNFIRDEAVADSAVKCVLGIFASKLPIDDAAEMTDRLPRELSLERLRGQQRRPIPIDVDEYLAEVSVHCNVSDESAQELVDRVMHLTRQAVGEELWSRVKEHLPGGWSRQLQRA